MCYAEETDLLEEEMCCVLQFFQRCSDWWRARVGSRAMRQDEVLREGHDSYALKQAACQDGMCAGFENQCRGLGGLVADGHAAYAKVKVDVEGGGSNEEVEERVGPMDPVDKHCILDCITHCITRYRMYSFVYLAAVVNTGNCLFGIFVSPL
jgi:hypothetical protein